MIGPLRQWFERDEQPALIGRAAAASSSTGKTTQVLNVRIPLDNLDKAEQLVRHGLKGNILRSLRGAAEHTGVLLGKESFGHDGEQIEVECHRHQQDAQHEKLVPQHPSQTPFIMAVQPIEGRASGLKDSSVLVFAFPLEQHRAHHRRG